MYFLINKWNQLAKIIIILLLFIPPMNCKKDNPTETGENDSEVKFLRGFWMGQGIEFIVSADGSEVCELRIEYQSSSCGITELGLDVRIPIDTDGKFQIKLGSNPEIGFTGEFTFKTEASGTWTIETHPPYRSCTANGTWSAEFEKEES